MKPISKSEFKAHALEVLREIEQSGESRFITNRGKPTLEIKKFRTPNLGNQNNPKNQLANIIKIS